MHYNYLIIGGGIAGITAAETVRAHDHTGTIGIISHENHLLYSRVILPHFVKGKVRREQVFLRTLDDFEKTNIDLILGKEAVFLNTSKKEVQLKSGEVYSFDKLLIASGGAPKPMGIPGEAVPGIFRLHTIDDADRLIAALLLAKNAIVIGGGFIALEFLDIMHVHKLTITLLCRDKSFFEGALDDAGGELMTKNFLRAGITPIFGDEVDAFGGDGSLSGLRTRSGQLLKADIVGIGIGLKRNDDFLLGTGVGEGPGQGAKTNEFLETAVTDIFAAGDIAKYFDVFSGEHHQHGNWTNAFLQGRVAGQNMASADKIPFVGVPFYSITNLGLHITFLGDVGEKEGVTAISRVEPNTNRYERFFLKDDILVGAVLINMFHDKPVLTELIEKKIPIGKKRADLADMAFDVKTLLAGG